MCWWYLTQERTVIRERLAAHGRKKLEALVREASHTALSRMKDRWVPHSIVTGVLPLVWSCRDAHAGRLQPGRGAASSSASQTTSLWGGMCRETALNSPARSLSVI